MANTSIEKIKKINKKALKNEKIYFYINNSKEEIQENMLKKVKNQKGAITVEATISLTAFLFMFMMLYSIIIVCRAQAIDRKSVV